jgi:hypothetical protein
LSDRAFLAGCPLPVRGATLSPSGWPVPDLPARPGDGEISLTEQFLGNRRRFGPAVVRAEGVAPEVGRSTPSVITAM